MNDRPVNHNRPFDRALGRRSIRLREWDYSSPGYYFLTVCIHDRWLLMFGDIVDGKMVLNDCGTIVREWIDKIPERYNGITVDAYAVMPNHVHLIIHIISKPPTESAVSPAVAPVVTPVGAIHELPLRGNPETYRKNRRIMTIPKIIDIIE